MLCSSYLLHLTALLSPKILDRPGSFLFPFPYLLVKFNPIFILIRQATVLPKLVHQMSIKNQMAFWIPFDIETALDPKGFCIKNNFFKLEDLCLRGEDTFNAPDSRIYRVQLSQKILVLVDSLKNSSFWNVGLLATPDIQHKFEPIFAKLSCSAHLLPARDAIELPPMVMFVLHPILTVDCFFSVEIASFLTLSVLLYLIVGLASNIFLSFLASYDSASSVSASSVSLLLLSLYFFVLISHFLLPILLCLVQGFYSFHNFGSNCLLIWFEFFNVK